MPLFIVANANRVKLQKHVIKVFKDKHTVMVQLVVQLVLRVLKYGIA